MIGMGHHPAGRNYTANAVRKVAALSAHRCNGDADGRGNAMGEIKDTAELTAGFFNLVETLATDLGRLTGRTAAEVLAGVAVQAAALADPST